MKPRDPQKIERIHEATLVLVSEIGLAGLTMSKIGKKAKLGMGTIYTYFESKEEIINSLYQFLKKKHSRELFGSINIQQSFLEKFRILFQAFFKYRYYSQAENFFIDQCKSSPALTPYSRELEDNTFDKARDLMEEGKAQGIVKDMDNDLLLSYVMGGIVAYVDHLKNQKVTLTQSLIDTAFDLCIDAIKA